MTKVTDGRNVNEVSAGAMRATFLAELRVGVARAKLATLDLESAGVAVKHFLVSPEQAMAELQACNALHWLFPDRESGA